MKIEGSAESDISSEESEKLLDGSMEEGLAEQFTNPAITAVIKEECIEEPLSQFILPDTNTFIKEEILTEDFRNEELTDKTVLSITNTAAGEEQNLAEPHSIFVPVPSYPDITVKEEFISEDEQDELADEHFSLNLETVTEDPSESKFHHEEHVESKQSTSDSSGTLQLSLSSVQTKTVHEAVGDYQCNICNKVFKKAQYLTLHTRKHAANRIYQCSVCHKVFASSSILSQHKLIHNEIKKYQCDICNKAFSRGDQLTAHKSIHSGSRNYKCDLCNKSFVNSNYLSKHKATHRSVKNHQCDLCDKAFSKLRYLRDHKLIHSGIKKHHCDVCNKAFSHSGSFTAHKLTHTDIHKYQCDLCSKAFTALGNLMLHKLSHRVSLTD